MLRHDHLHDGAAGVVTYEVDLIEAQFIYQLGDRVGPRPYGGVVNDRGRVSLSGKIHRYAPPLIGK
ncbi:hypothetical protein BMG05_19995 [Mycobacterium malmoense]|nr:hypothetical protein BMG05_19995 [Mycobacterium malmoense]